MSFAAKWAVGLTAFGLLPSSCSRLRAAWAGRAWGSLVPESSPMRWCTRVVDGDRCGLDKTPVPTLPVRVSTDHDSVARTDDLAGIRGQHEVGGDRS